MLQNPKYEYILQFILNIMSLIDLFILLVLGYGFPRDQNPDERCARLVVFFFQLRYEIFSELSII